MKKIILTICAILGIGYISLGGEAKLDTFTEIANSESAYFAQHDTYLQVKKDSILPAYEQGTVKEKLGKNLSPDYEVHVYDTANGEKGYQVFNYKNDGSVESKGYGVEADSRTWFRQAPKEPIATSTILSLYSSFLDFFNPYTAFGANTHAIDLERSSSQYLTAVDSTSLSFTDDFTLEAWLRVEELPSSLGGKTNLITKGDAYNWYISSDDTMTISYTPNNTTIYTDVTTNADAVTSADVGNCVYFAMVCDVSTKDCLMYRGDATTEVAEMASTPTLTGGGATSVQDNASAMVIGANNTPNFYFDGMFDDVRIWSALKTSGELETSKATELVGSETNLVAYYKLNDSLLDETANDNDLTNNNAAVFSTNKCFGGSAATFTGSSYFGEE